MSQEQELYQMWQRTLGEPPMLEQFGVWTVLHTADVVRLGILRTARKNLALGGTMTIEYKVRFASRVMIVQSQRNAEHAVNKERLQAEMESVR